MTGFQECYEMGLGRTDAFNNVPLCEEWSEPRKLSFLHWKKLRRKRSVQISIPADFRRPPMAPQWPDAIEDQPSLVSGREAA